VSVCLCRTTALGNPEVLSVVAAHLCAAAAAALPGLVTAGRFSLAPTQGSNPPACAHLEVSQPEGAFKHAYAWLEGRCQVPADGHLAMLRGELQRLQAGLAVVCPCGHYCTLFIALCHNQQPGLRQGLAPS
jgi:hypothetical protein